MTILLPAVDASEQEQTAFITTLKQLLRTEILLVEFTKQDGSVRQMKCTLKPEHLPIVEATNSSLTKSRKQSTSSIPVFDLDKNAWRSFSINALSSVTVTTS